jgi:hypothetical protein
MLSIGTLTANGPIRPYRSVGLWITQDRSGRRSLRDAPGAPVEQIVELGEQSGVQWRAVEDSGDCSTP